LQTDRLSLLYDLFLRMEFCEKASWFLAIITNGICPVVSIFYWAFLFPQLDLAMSFDITFLHLFNTLCVLLDLCVTARPVRISHIIYPILVGLSYATFSLFYCVLGGTDKVGKSWIYPHVLSWKKPGIASLTPHLFVSQEWPCLMFSSGAAQELEKIFTSH